MNSIENRPRIKVNVDGHEQEVYEGLTILQALVQEGIHIPHLCYDIRLERSNGNCGLCVVTLLGPEGEESDVKACQTPILAGMVMNTKTAKLEAYRKIRLEQLLSDHNADCVAPCVTTCPANIDIQSYLRQVGNGNYQAALRIIKDRNPFPSACGRVCPHPCESKCRRNLVDSPVAINHVKRFVADRDMEGGEPWLPPKAKPSGKRVAVVGAGPSGLSAAYYLSIAGHEVTVFERQSKAGGMMRYGIPEYRLPKATLDAEIDVIRGLGVNILTGKALGTHIRLEDLQKDFDAVYMAIGSWRATPLQLEGENSEGVWLGIQYLEQVTKGIDVKLGKTTVVIGGGNTAIDCARTALRKGSGAVKLIYRRTREEMPAEPYEIEEAVHEGVEMIFLAAPAKIAPAASGTKELHCIRMELGEPDRSGRRRPVPVEGSDFVIEADTVIGAIGQSTNTQFLYNDFPVKLNKWGDVEVNPKTLQTSEPKIFSGGDCVTGPATVIQAVGSGRRAAESIDGFLTRGYAKEGNANYACSRGSLEDLPRWEFEEMPRIPRAQMPAMALSARAGNFDEIERGLEEAEAKAEARRCLKCGCAERYSCDLRREAKSHGVAYKKPVHERPYVPLVDDHPFIIRDHNKCISCGRCIAACAQIEGPDVLSFYLKSGRLLVGTKSGKLLQETDCVSCGQCVNACPCGALEYRRERGKVFRAINDKKKTVVGFVAPAVRSVVSSEFGVDFAEASPFMAGLLKKLGFDKVFDFSFAADLTIVEETTEFLSRVSAKGALPQFTSCCPGWVNFAERRYPELIPHLSSCKSPQQMMGATVKNHFGESAGLARDEIFVVSIVPCLAKKYEAARPEFAPDGIRDVDAVLTTTELFEMLKLARIDVKQVEPREFDEPYRRVTGAGVLFGASGGVAEASLRMAVEKLTGKPLVDHLDFTEVRGFEGLKESTVDADGQTVRVAVISGLANVEPLAKRIISGEDVGYDLIEVMACPGGCICGAGHPVPQRVGDLAKRQRVLIDIDKTSVYRKSQENPDILRLYGEYFGEPNSRKAHDLLHTAYGEKEGDSKCGPGIANKDDSAFPSHAFTVCVCEACAQLGSKKLFAEIEGRIKALKMDSFVSVKSMRMQGHDSGSGVHLTLDGRRIDPDKLSDLYKSVKS
jgi:formate dehydrogenase major subunit